MVEVRIRFDTHTHTLASTHAYSTFTENATYAAKVGMDGFAVTDHAPALPDAPHEWHFRNLKNIPRDMYGQKILIGVELNILDNDGNIDLPEDILETLDVVNASIHQPAYGSNDINDHTGAYEGVINNPYVDIICHSGSHIYTYDYEYIIKLARDKGKLMEINNHSFFVRKHSIENCRKIALLCKKYGTGIVVSSDAHYCTDIGDYRKAIEMLNEIDFPEELVMNRTYDVFKEYMESVRGKKMMRWTLDSI